MSVRIFAFVHFVFPPAVRRRARVLYAICVWLCIVVSNMPWLYIRVTLRVSYDRQGLLTLRQHLDVPPGLVEVSVAKPPRCTPGVCWGKCCSSPRCTPGFCWGKCCSSPRCAPGVCWGRCCSSPRCTPDLTPGVHLGDQQHLPQQTPGGTSRWWATPTPTKPGA
jgi:hypothetical protein